MIYFGVFFGLLVIHFATFNDKHVQRFAFWMCIVLLLVFVGLRFEVGCDWNNYYRWHGITSQWGWFEVLATSDIFYFGLNKFVHSFDGSFLWMVLFVAAIFFAGLAYFASREDNPVIYLFFAYPLLIVSLSMTLVRQSAALGVLMLSLYFFFNRRPFLFSLGVLIASGFHTSAAFFFVFLPLIGRKLSTGSIIGLVVTASAVALIIFQLDIGQRMFDRYNNDKFEANGALFRLVYLVIPSFVFIVFMRKRWQERYPEDYPLVFASMLACLALLALLSFSVSSVVADRMGYYFAPFQALILARASSLFNNNEAKFVGLLAIGYVIVFFLGWMEMSPIVDRCYIPYDSYLNDWF